MLNLWISESGRYLFVQYYFVWDAATVEITGIWEINSRKYTSVEYPIEKTIIGGVVSENGRLEILMDGPKYEINAYTVSPIRNAPASAPSLIPKDIGARIDDLLKHKSFLTTTIPELEAHVRGGNKREAFRRIVGRSHVSCFFDSENFEGKTAIHVGDKEEILAQAHANSLSLSQRGILVRTATIDTGRISFEIAQNLLTSSHSDGTRRQWLLDTSAQRSWDNFRQKEVETEAPTCIDRESLKHEAAETNSDLVCVLQKIYVNEMGVAFATSLADEDRIIAKKIINNVIRRHGSISAAIAALGPTADIIGIERGASVAVGLVSNKLLLMGHADGNLEAIDVDSMQRVWLERVHTGIIDQVSNNLEGDRIIASSQDGSIAILKLGPDNRPNVLARLYAVPNGDWLSISDAGFFTSSRRDADMLVVVRGLEATTIGQVHQSLYNPDLVREALAGDPDGQVKSAAQVINLEKVLDSGPAPEVLVSSSEGESKSSSDLVSIPVRIKDRGKGIGRIEWRVNGITAAVRNAPVGTGPIYEVSQEIALDPGDNAIEIVAYNASNLLASLPIRTNIAFIGATDAVKPKLHVLAIGINNYVDKGGIAPGETKAKAFPPLNLATRDATAFGVELQKAAAGLYSEVRVRTVLDSEATAATLDAIVTEMAAGVHPRDTFVLFAAAHGYSHEGRLYLIPQDYQGGPNSKALATGAIDQLRLQDWIANRIKARKALILLDTCESGALTSGYTRSRVKAPASEAGVGRLHEATGRPVLTAAAEGQYAHEGVISSTGERHGIFTWAVLDAFHNGDINGDGIIDLSELVEHVQRVVPGLANGLARAVTRSEPVFGRQTPRFGSLGENFPLVRRVQ